MSWLHIEIYFHNIYANILAAKHCNRRISHNAHMMSGLPYTRGPFNGLIRLVCTLGRCYLLLGIVELGISCR